MANAKLIYANLIQAVKDRFIESIPNRLPSPAFQAQHIKVIDELIKKGIWDGLDFFYYFASDDNFTLKTLNWVDPYGPTGSFNNQDPSLIKFGPGYNNQALVLKEGTYFDTNINLKTTLINKQTPKINSGPKDTFIGVLKGPSTFGSTTFFGVGDAADPTFTGKDNDMIALMVGSSGFQNALFRSFNTAKADGDYNYKTGAFINYNNKASGLFNYSNITGSLTTTNLEFRAGMYIVEHTQNYTNWIYNNKIVRQSFKTINAEYPGKVPDGDILLGAIGEPAYVKSGYASSVERPFITQSFGTFNQGNLGPLPLQGDFAVLADNIIGEPIPLSRDSSYPVEYVELPPQKVSAAVNYANGSYLVYNSAKDDFDLKFGDLTDDTGKAFRYFPEIEYYNYDYSQHFKSYQDVYNNPKDGDIFWSKWPNSITSGSDFEIEISRIAKTASSAAPTNLNFGLFNYYKADPVVQYINPLTVSKNRNNVITYDSAWINNNSTFVGFNLPTTVLSITDKIKNDIKIINSRAEGNILTALNYGQYWIGGTQAAGYFGKKRKDGNTVGYGIEYWGEQYGKNPIFPSYRNSIILSGLFNKTFCFEDSPSYNSNQPPSKSDLIIKPYTPIDSTGKGICTWYPPARVAWVYTGLKTGGFINGKTFETVATNILTNPKLKSVLIPDEFLVAKGLNLPIKSLLPPPPYGKLLLPPENVQLKNTAQFYLKNTGALIGFAIDHEFSPDYFKKDMTGPDPKIGWTGLLPFTSSDIITIKNQNFIVEKQKWTIRALVTITQNEWKTSFPSSSLDTTFIVDITNSNRKITNLNLQTKNFSKSGFFVNIKGKSDVNLNGVDISQTYITDVEINKVLLFDEVTDKKVVKSIVDFEKNKTFQIRTSDPRFGYLRTSTNNEKILIPIGLISNKLSPGSYVTQSFTITNLGSSTATNFNYTATTSWPTSSFQTVDKRTVFITNANGGILYSPEELDDLFFNIPISGTVGTSYTFNYRPVFGSKDDAGKLPKILSSNTYYLKHRIPAPNYTTDYSGTGVNQTLGSGTTQTFICAFGGGGDFDDLTQMYKIFYDAAYSAYFSAAKLPKTTSSPVGNTDVTIGLPLLNYGNDAKYSVILKQVASNVTRVNWQERKSTPTDSLKNMIDPTQAVDTTVLNYTTSSLVPSFYLYNPLP
jgi:hypothetical protein